MLKLVAYCFNIVMSATITGFIYGHSTGISFSSIMSKVSGLYSYGRDYNIKHIRAHMHLNHISELLGMATL